MFAAGYCLAQGVAATGFPGSILAVGSDPGTPIFEVTGIFIVNLNAPGDTFTLHYARNGAIPGLETRLYSNVPLNTDETWNWQSQAPGGGIMMERNSQLYLLGSAAGSIYYTVFGVSSNVGGADGRNI